MTEEHEDKESLTPEVIRHRAEEALRAAGFPEVTKGMTRRAIEQFVLGVLRRSGEVILGPNPYSDPEEERRICAALIAAGVPVSSLHDLDTVADRHSAAVAVLIELLPRVRNQALKVALASALRTKKARGVAAKPLVDEFLRAGPDQDEVKWTIADVLTVVGDDSVFQELCAIAEDKQHGSARKMVVLSLGRSKDSRAVDVLIRLMDDEEVAGHAVMALGRLKAERAKSHIERFLEHPMAWVRREARRALARISAVRGRPPNIH